MIIPVHPTWEIIDSSKLDTWLDCQRQFFFTHLLGWRVDRPAHDVHFGNAWHKAREWQLIHGYLDIAGAYKAFLDYYRNTEEDPDKDGFEPDTDEMYRPKDPTNVLNAITKFAEERQGDLTENELLFTEISGSVPIDEKRVLYYRMDSILRNLETEMVFSWDHKSAKRFSRPWEEKFHLSIQNGTYTHCMYCIFPIEEVMGVEFCGTCFEWLSRGSKLRGPGYHINFRRVPAFKTPDQMNVWLWNVNKHYDEIERQLDWLSHCKEGDAVMMAFPMNTNSCTKYWGCAFHDYCISWPNPLQRCAEPPLGFKVEFWDPREMETTHKMELEWRK